MSNQLLLIKNISVQKRNKILKVLSELYPIAASELQFTSPYQLIIAVVLSAQCTDKMVNRVSPSLFSFYSDFASLANASIESVENIIRPINYYKNKSRHIISLSEKILNNFEGKLPDNYDDFITLPGVGRKTANVVMSELGLSYALAVDTHVYRVSRRLGLSHGTNVLQVEHDLMKQFAPSTWRTLHHSLILHGRRICSARVPRCHQCPLFPLCSYGQEQ